MMSSVDAKYLTQFAFTKTHICQVKRSIKFTDIYFFDNFQKRVSLTPILSAKLPNLTKFG